MNTNDGYLLADDLSGALEVGAMFRARGWRVTVDFRGTARPPDSGEVQVVSTETRNTGEVEAARIIGEIVAGRRTAGARLLFKKIDSTLRGPITAELQAVIAELAPQRVVICTANPPAGRTVVDGVVHVHGVPLERTDFRYDPIWPALTGSIPALLRGQGLANCEQLTIEDLRAGTDKIAAIVRGAAPGGTRIVVADAETVSDLRRLAEALVASEPVETLFIGASAFAAALAETWRSPAAPPVERPLVRNGMLVVCGSRHPASRRQVELLERERVCPVFTVVPGQTEPGRMARLARPALEQGAAAIRFAVADEGAACDPRQMLALIAGIAEEVIRTGSVQGVYLTGGETAAAVCRRCDAERLEIIGEIEPGVVEAVLRLEGGRSLLLLTKPGGYGAPDSMREALRTVMK